MSEKTKRRPETDTVAEKLPLTRFFIKANVAKIAAARKLLTDVYWVWQAAVA